MPAVVWIQDGAAFALCRGSRVSVPVILRPLDLESKDAVSAANPMRCLAQTCLSSAALSALVQTGRWWQFLRTFGIESPVDCQRFPTCCNPV